MSTHAMTIRPDVEDIQTTRTEKLLAVILTAFLLLGGIWTYTRIDDLVRTHVEVPVEAVARDPAVVRAQEAQAQAFRAQVAVDRTLQNLELKREAYRTALTPARPRPSCGGSTKRQRRPTPRRSVASRR